MMLWRFEAWRIFKDYSKHGRMDGLPKKWYLGSILKLFVDASERCYEEELSFFLLPNVLV